MIPTALYFSRYRAFRDEVRLPLAPLTIVIGKNGGGKSIITRLPLVLAGGLHSDAEGPLNLEAGGITHAARFEDLIYQRSAQPFSLGADIGDGNTTYSFRSILRHIVETHSLGVEAFQLSRNGQPLVDFQIERPEDLGRAGANFLLRDSNKPVKPRLVGLFPDAIEGEDELSKELVLARRAFEQALGRPSYLGPFRAEHGSIPRVPRQGVRDLGPRGERTLDVLGNDAIRGNGELVRSVEDWFEWAMNGNRAKLIMNGDLPRMVVHDRARDVDVDLSDTGAGFAQVLPVIVQALGRNSNTLTEPLVIVEQPELHLHPAAHGCVADAILEASKSNQAGLRYICETHSEQVVTRIRRRVAEGKYPSQGVQIVSVGHQTEPTSPPEPLRIISIDDDGNPSSWPIGVFDEALDDIVHLREAVRLRGSPTTGT